MILGKLRPAKHAILAGIAIAAMVDPVFAAGGDEWVQPATGFLETLESGLVKIGSVVVGLGVIIVGLLAAAMGKMAWDRFGYVVLGGLLVMTGPAALRALLESVS